MTTYQPSLSKIFLISDYWVVEKCLETNCYTKKLHRMTLCIVDIHLDIKFVQTLELLHSKKGKQRSVLKLT